MFFVVIDCFVWELNFVIGFALIDLFQSLINPSNQHIQSHIKYRIIKAKLTLPACRAV